MKKLILAIMTASLLMGCAIEGEDQEEFNPVAPTVVVSEDEPEDNTDNESNDNETEVLSLPSVVDMGFVADNSTVTRTEGIVRSDINVYSDGLKIKVSSTTCTDTGNGVSYCNAGFYYSRTGDTIRAEDNSNIVEIILANSKEEFDTTEYIGTRKVIGWIEVDGTWSTTLSSGTSYTWHEMVWVISFDRYSFDPEKSYTVLITLDNVQRSIPIN